MHVPAPPDFPFPSLHFLPPILVSVLLFFGSFFFFFCLLEVHCYPFSLGLLLGKLIGCRREKRLERVVVGTQAKR